MKFFAFVVALVCALLFVSAAEACPTVAVQSHCGVVQSFGAQVFVPQAVVVQSAPVVVQAAHPFFVQQNVVRSRAVVRQRAVRPARVRSFSIQRTVVR